ncbi:porin family protein [Hymenobacter sp. M29]|uniref:Porin family protein n=1 Tax=Hymenobacter mellowenesis TaxID=3063995 RepID=A0ABT9A9Z6_9BACT|nr:porin family protein [Hymenobacter sp. M29]MDO7846242.1 porin family protein [Hymenobacter sp. M29]
MRHLLLALSGLLLTGTAHAQFIGLQAGALYGTLATPANTSSRHTAATGRVGYHVEAFYEFPLTAHLSLVPGLAFSHQSTNLVTGNPNPAEAPFEAVYQLTFNQSSLPILLRATRDRFYVEAGPQLGVLLNTNERGTLTYLGYGPTTLQFALDNPSFTDYQRLQAGVCLGAGVKLPAGFGLDLRAYAGLTKLKEQYEPGIYSYGSDIRSRTVQASLTYQRPIKR